MHPFVQWLHRSAPAAKARHAGRPSANPSTILISHGDMKVSGVNFGLTPARQGTPAHGWKATSGGAASGTDLVPDVTVIDALFAGTGGRRERHGG
jgi:hypothetical protein